MARALGNLDVRKYIIVVCDHKNAKNEWKDDKEIVFQSPSAKKDAKDPEKFHQFVQGHQLQKTNAMKTLETYDANFYPKAVPYLCIGGVVNQGAYLPSRKIHAD